MLSLLYVILLIEGGDGFINAFPTLADIIQSAVHQDFSFSDQKDPACKSFDILHVMCGEYHGSVPGSIQLFDEITHSQFGYGIQAYGRLVQKKQLRRMQERGGDFTAHSLTEGSCLAGVLRSWERFKSSVSSSLFFR